MSKDLKCLLWDRGGTKWSPIRRDGYAKLYLYNDSEFYMVDTIADNFYGDDSHCCFKYDHTGNTIDMLKSCRIAKKDFSNSKETIHWLNCVKSMVENEKDVRDEVKEYVTTKTSIITADDPIDSPQGCLSLNDWYEIMSRNITFDQNYLEQICIE